MDSNHRWNPRRNSHRLVDSPRDQETLESEIQRVAGDRDAESPRVLLTVTTLTWLQLPVTVVLKEQASGTLIPTSPFDFDGTVFRPDHFPSQDMYWEPGRFWQTMRWKRENYGIRLDNEGTNRKPSIKATLFAGRRTTGPTVDEILGEVRWRFDLDSTGIPWFIRNFRHDRYLGPPIRRHPECA